jgi:PKD domain
LRNGSKIIPDPKGVCQIDNTQAIQAPNGDVNADLAINVVSHEYSETITDPLVKFGHSGWFHTNPPGNDVLGTEGGDNCEVYGTFTLPAGYGNNPNAFRPTLGGNAAAGTLYTQLINGHRYYLQSEWSNGTGNCAMRPSPGRITDRFTVPKGVSWVGAALSFNPALSFSRYPYSSATWDFGDGSPTAFRSGRATLTRVTHRYRRAGRYTVTLTLIDNRGNLQSTTGRVSVHARRK